MTQIPADELDVMQPWFTPNYVLEFGNKKNATGRYREWYAEQGVEVYHCIDWNGEDGAIPLDVNFAICPTDIDDPDHLADLITNFGFSEHVTNQPQFWENVHNLCYPGGYMVGVTPCPGFWPSHGILQPQPTFYKMLAEANGYEIHKLHINEQRRRHTVCYRFQKLEDSSFIMPDGWEDHIIPTPQPSIQSLKSSGLSQNR